MGKELAAHVALLTMTEVGTSSGSKIALAGADGGTSAARADTPLEVVAIELELLDAAVPAMASGRNEGIGAAVGSKSTGDSRRLTRTVIAKMSPEPLSWRDSVSIWAMMK